MIAFLQQHIPPAISPMCGNSICQDRRFLAQWMPQLEAYFHYRNLDVSTLKELAKRWKPEMLAGLTKQCEHEALADIHDSIAELKITASILLEYKDQASLKVHGFPTSLAGAGLFGSRITSIPSVRKKYLWLQELHSLLRSIQKYLAGSRAWKNWPMISGIAGIARHARCFPG